MSTDWKKKVRTGNMMGRPGDFMTLELSWDNCRWMVLLAGWNYCIYPFRRHNPCNPSVSSAGFYFLQVNMSKKIFNKQWLNGSFPLGRYLLCNLFLWPSVLFLRILITWGFQLEVELLVIFSLSILKNHHLTRSSPPQNKETVVCSSHQKPWLAIDRYWQCQWIEI